MCTEAASWASCTSASTRDVGRFSSSKPSSSARFARREGLYRRVIARAPMRGGGKRSVPGLRAACWAPSWRLSLFLGGVRWLDSSGPGPCRALRLAPVEALEAAFIEGGDEGEGGDEDGDEGEDEDEDEDEDEPWFTPRLRCIHSRGRLRLRAPRLASISVMVEDRHSERDVVILDLDPVQRPMVVFQWMGIGMGRDEIMERAGCTFDVRFEADSAWSRRPRSAQQTQYRSFRSIRYGRAKVRFRRGRASIATPILNESSQ